MRKITQESVNAFLNGSKFNKSNMNVHCYDYPEEVITGEVITHVTTDLILHGNVIARMDNGRLFITNAGWATNTTKERLNGLSGVSITQKDFIWYLNGKEWDGSWIEID